MARSVAVSKPELTPLAEFPLPVSELLDPLELELEVGFGVAAVPSYATPLAVAATWNTEPPPYS